MNNVTSSGFPPRRSTMRAMAMNTALVMLLAGVFLWSVAGNALNQIRSAVEKKM
jgi:hypothetical protein